MEFGRIFTQDPRYPYTSLHETRMHRMDEIKFGDTAQVGWYIRYVQYDGMHWPILTAFADGPGEKITSIEAPRAKLVDPSTIQPPADDLAAWMSDEGGLVWTFATIARKEQTASDNPQLIGGYPELPE